MSVPLIGILASAACIFFLSLLFRFERNRETRFFGRVRKEFDNVILRTEGVTQSISEYLGGDFASQFFHFFVHTVLLTFLRFLETSRGQIEKLLRANRRHAKRPSGERTTRNKLDEIADHKASVAFSTEERRKHKEKSLFG